MAQVFIIHAPFDEGLADHVAAALSEAGHEPLSSAQSDGASAQDSRLAIAVWTRESCRNEAVINAALEAAARGVLISIDFEDAATPHELADPPPVNLTGWAGGASDPRWRFVLSEIDFAVRCNPTVASAAFIEKEASEERLQGEVPASAIVSDADWPPESENVPETETEDRFAHEAGQTIGTTSAYDAPIYVDEIDSGAPVSYPVKSRTTVRIHPLHAVLGAGVGLFVLTAGAMFLAPAFMNEQERLEVPPLAQNTDDADTADVTNEVTTQTAATSVTVASLDGQTDNQGANGVASETATQPVDEPASAASFTDENVVDLPTPSEQDAARQAATGSIGTPSNTREVVAENIPERTVVATTPDVNDDNDIALQSVDSANDTSLPEALPNETPTIETPAIETRELETLVVETVDSDAENDAEGDASDTMGALVAAVTTEITEASANIPTDNPGTNSALGGDYFRDCAACPEMASLPAGRFSMGSPASEPARQSTEGPRVDVTFAKGFAMSAREVTFAQWEACVADGGCRGYAPYDSGWGRNDRPVIGVSYQDAEAFAAWLTAKTGVQYRIPSEAEWEYGARAGSETAFSFGRVISTDEANFNGDHAYGVEGGVNRAQTTPAGSFAPNAYGLYDMHGNVWEWTADCWSESHQESAENGAVSQGSCDRRVLKGGAWNTGGWRLRAAHRIAKTQSAREYDNGFRVVRDLD